MAHNDHENIARSAFDETEDEVFKAEGATRDTAIRVFPEAVEEPSETLPPYIKVDCTIAEELFVPGCGCLTIFAAIFLINIAGASQARFAGYILAALGAAAVISRAFIDNFYIINTAERKIYYRRKVFNQTNLTPFLENTDIYAISVLCTLYKNKSRRWHEYKVVIIKKDAFIVDFGDYIKNADISEINKRARGIAAVMQCGYIECPDKHTLFTFKEINGGVRAYFIKKE